MYGFTGDLDAASDIADMYSDSDTAANLSDAHDTNGLMYELHEPDTSSNNNTATSSTPTSKASKEANPATGGMYSGMLYDRMGKRPDKAITSFADLTRLEPHELAELHQQLETILMYNFSAVEFEQGVQAEPKFSYRGMEVAAAPRGRLVDTSLRGGAVLDGRYIVVRPIGGGQHGTVYAGIDKLLRQPVSIKATDKALWLRGDVKFLPRVSGLFPHAEHCEHIPLIYDYGVEEVRSGEFGSSTREYSIIVSELLPGDTLAHMIEMHMLRGEHLPIPALDAVEIATYVLRALHACHTNPRKFTHNDVHPGNVLIEERVPPLNAGTEHEQKYRAWLIDFGIASDQTDQLVSAQNEVYTSPQVMAGSNPAPTDDTYSVGALLFETLTFSSTDSHNRPFSHPNFDASDLTRLQQTVISDGLVRVICRALSRDPTERYTAAEMIDALASCRSELLQLTRQQEREQAVHINEINSSVHQWDLDRLQAIVARRGPQVAEETLPYSRLTLLHLLARSSYTRLQTVRMRLRTWHEIDSNAVVASWRGRPVFVKRVHADQASLLAYLKREAAILEKLPRHDHLQRFLAFASRDNWHYLVTEYAEAGSLEDVIFKRNKLKLLRDIPALLQIVIDAGRALEHLHRQGLVHRNLQAASLMVTRDERGVLGRLNHALPAKQGVQSMYRRNKAMYKGRGVYPLGWMAPESLTGDEGSEYFIYSTQSDVYMFGMTLFEVFARRQPYDGLGFGAPMVRAIRDNQVRPQLPPTVAPELAEIIRSCWAPEPDERPTIGDVVERLAALHRSMVHGVGAKRAAVARAQVRDDLLMPFLHEDAPDVSPTLLVEEDDVVLLNVNTEHLLVAERTAMTDFLLDLGQIDTGAVDSTDGQSALHMVAEMRGLGNRYHAPSLESGCQVLTRLLAHGADRILCDKRGQTPLHLVRSCVDWHDFTGQIRDEPLAEALLSQYPDTPDVDASELIEATDLSGQTALHAYVSTAPFARDNLAAWLVVNHRAKVTTEVVGTLLHRVASHKVDVGVHARWAAFVLQAIIERDLEQSHIDSIEMLLAQRHAQSNQRPRATTFLFGAADTRSGMSYFAEDEEDEEDEEKEEVMEEATCCWDRRRHRRLLEEGDDEDEFGIELESVGSALRGGRSEGDQEEEEEEEARQRVSPAEEQYPDVTLLQKLSAFAQVLGADLDLLLQTPEVAGVLASLPEWIFAFSRALTQDLLRFFVKTLSALDDDDLDRTRSFIKELLFIEAISPVLEAYQRAHAPEAAPAAGGAWQEDALAHHSSSDDDGMLVLPSDGGARQPQPMPSAQKTQQRDIDVFSLLLFDSLSSSTDIRIIEFLLTLAPEALSQVHPTRKTTAVEEAAFADQPQVLKRLLKAGARVWESSQENRPNALHWAIGGRLLYRDEAVKEDEAPEVDGQASSTSTTYSKFSNVSLDLRRVFRSVRFLADRFSPFFKHQPGKLAEFVNARDPEGWTPLMLTLELWQVQDDREREVRARMDRHVARHERHRRQLEGETQAVEALEEDVEELRKKVQSLHAQTQRDRAEARKDTKLLASCQWRKDVLVDMVFFLLRRGASAQDLKGYATYAKSFRSILEYGLQQSSAESSAHENHRLLKGREAYMLNDKYWLIIHVNWLDSDFLNEYDAGSVAELSDALHYVAYRGDFPAFERLGEYTDKTMFRAAVRHRGSLLHSFLASRSTNRSFWRALLASGAEPLAVDYMHPHYRLLYGPQPEATAEDIDASDDEPSDDDDGDVESAAESRSKSRSKSKSRGRAMSRVPRTAAEAMAAAPITVLMLACYRAQFNIVRELVEDYALNVNATLGLEMSALHFTCHTLARTRDESTRHEAFRVLVYLLGKQARCDDPDAFGVTPLGYLFSCPINSESPDLVPDEIVEGIQLLNDAGASFDKSDIPKPLFRRLYLDRYYDIIEIENAAAARRDELLELARQQPLLTLGEDEGEQEEEPQMNISVEAADEVRVPLVAKEEHSMSRPQRTRTAFRSEMRYKRAKTIAKEERRRHEQSLKERVVHYFGIGKPVRERVSPDCPIFKDKLFQYMVKENWKAHVRKPMLWRLLVYLVFMVLVVLASLWMGHGRHPAEGYYLTQSLTELFVREEVHYTKSRVAERTLQNLYDTEQLWLWLKGPLYDGVYRPRTTFRSGDGVGSLPDPAMFVADVNRLVSGVRIRQHRVRRERCEHDRFVEAGFSPWCFPSFEAGESQDEGTIEVSPEVERVRQAGALSSRSPSDSESWRGLFATYPEESFWVDLPRNATEAQELLDALESASWLDLHTRAVNVEFAVHNPALDVLVLVRLSVEVAPSGAVAPSFNFETFKSLRELFFRQGELVFLELLIVVLVVLHVVYEVNDLFRDRYGRTCGVGRFQYLLREYWFSGFHYLEWCLYLLLLSLFAVRLVLTSELRDVGDGDGGGRVDLQGLSGLLTAEKWMTALVFFLLFVNLVQYLYVFRAVALFSLMLQKMVKEYVKFLLFMLVVVVGFTGTFVVIFDTAPNFRNFGVAFVSVLSAGLANVDLGIPTGNGQHRIVGPVLVIFFSLLVVLLMLNLLIAVLNSAYSKVKRELGTPRWTFEQFKALPHKRIEGEFAGYLRRMARRRGKGKGKGRRASGRGVL